MGIKYGYYRKRPLLLVYVSDKFIDRHWAKRSPQILWKWWQRIKRFGNDDNCINKIVRIFNVRVSTALTILVCLVMSMNGIICEVQMVMSCINIEVTQYIQVFYVCLCSYLFGVSDSCVSVYSGWFRFVSSYALGIVCIVYLRM